MNKENLIKYAKTIGVKINEDEPIENIYEKVTGNNYNVYLKEQEETKKERYRINYEKIPQRKLILKKNNVKVLQGIFPNELNKRHMILKCKKGKRIILLNIWVRLSRNSYIIVKLPDYVELSKDINGNLYVKYEQIPPYDFELEYFTVKNGFASASQNKLSIKNEILYEVSESIMKNLT